MKGMDVDNLKRKNIEGGIELRKQTRDGNFMKRRNLYSEDPYANTQKQINLAQN